MLRRSSKSLACRSAVVLAFLLSAPLLRGEHRVRVSQLSLKVANRIALSLLPGYQATAEAARKLFESREAESGRKRRVYDHYALSSHHKATTGSRRIVTTHVPVAQQNGQITVNGIPASTP